MATGKSPKRRNRKSEAFYGRALDESEKLKLEEAHRIEGLDEEIAVLRVKLRQLIESHPERLDLCLSAASTIARLVKVRYNISREQKKSLKEAITRVLTEIAIPIGGAVTKAVLKQ